MDVTLEVVARGPSTDLSPQGRARRHLVRAAPGDSRSRHRRRGNSPPTREAGGGPAAAATPRAGEPAASRAPRRLAARRVDHRGHVVVRGDAGAGARGARARAARSGGGSADRGGVPDRHVERLAVRGGIVRRSVSGGGIRSRGSAAQPAPAVLRVRTRDGAAAVEHAVYAGGLSCAAAILFNVRAAVARYTLCADDAHPNQVVGG